MLVESIIKIPCVVFSLAAVSDRPWWRNDRSSYLVAFFHSDFSSTFLLLLMDFLVFPWTRGHVCVCRGEFSLCGLGKILSVRLHFAVAAGEVVSDCKSLLSSQFFGCFAHCLSLWQISAPSGTWLVPCRV